MFFTPGVTDPEILNAIVIAISMMATSRELCNLLLEAGALGRGSGVELILQNFDSEARDVRHCSRSTRPPVPFSCSLIDSLCLYFSANGPQCNSLRPESQPRP